MADSSLDRVAIDLIMGHPDPSMGAHYRERIDDSRLQAVTEHVRVWLFGPPPDGGTGTDNAVLELREPCDSPQENGGDDVPLLKLYAG